MGAEDPLFFKLLCKINWKGEITSVLRNGEKLSLHETKCPDECSYEFVKKWLTPEEIGYLIEKGRASSIRGLTPEEESLYKNQVVAVIQ